MVPTAAAERNRRSRCRCGRGGRMRAGALVSPCHVMAGLVPAIHVFARSSTDLAERDARNKSGHDERSGRTGETARLTQSHANFRIGTLARLSNQGCGLRGDFWPHREGDGLPQRRRAGPRPFWTRPTLQLSPRPALSQSRSAQPGHATAPQDRGPGDYLVAPKAPMIDPTISSKSSISLMSPSNAAVNVPTTPSGTCPT